MFQSDLPLPAAPLEAQFRRDRTRLVMLRTGHRLRRSLAAAALILAAAFGLVDLLNDPFALLPAAAAPTAPTLVALAALATALLTRKPLSRPGLWEMMLLCIAGGVGISQLTWESLLTAAPSAPDAMGTNTALAVLALAGAIALRRHRPAWLAIALALVPALICLSALVGYAMGLGRLGGAPTPATLLLMIPLVVSSLIGQAHRPAFRTLLRDDPVTRMLRRELALAIFLPCAIAILIFRIHPGGATTADALYTQAMILFCGTGVIVGGRLRDRLDCERRQLSRALHRASLQDPLTRLANRRGAMHLADRVIAQARRSGKPVSVMLCDLDHFKAINDRFGHGIGDQVLQEAASLLSGRIGRDGIAGRWGGEEFLFLLPDTGLVQAQELAEEMRRSLRRDLHASPNGIVANGKGGVAVTASFGCALLDPARPDAFERAVEEADHGLYAAKRAGRDLVVSMPATTAARAGASPLASA